MPHKEMRSLKVRFQENDENDPEGICHTFLYSSQVRTTNPYKL